MKKHNLNLEMGIKLIESQYSLLQGILNNALGLVKQNSF